MTANKHCEGCDRRFRPRGSTLADYPGTIRHHGRGLCSTCSVRKRRGLDMHAPVKLTPARVAYVHRELEAYLRWRGRDITKIGIAS